jgi:nucleotide-binding universal stress UspA family protein
MTAVLPALPEWVGDGRFNSTLEGGKTMSEILVGVDGTDGGRDALAFARRLAVVTGARLRLANAFPYDDTHTRASNEAFRRALLEDAESVLAEADGWGAPRQAVADVSPPHALHELAEDTAASLVVVGSTCRGPVGRVLPGSTGERLLHGSPCPVAIVPHGYRSREHEIRVIGVGYDGSEESEAALASACELARHMGAGLRVIRVFDTSQIGTPALMSGPGYISIPRDLERTQREQFEHRVAQQPIDIEIESVFVAGIPSKELPAQSESLDLLIMGSRGYGPLRAVLLGGVSHALVRKAACPVIILPRESTTGLAALLENAAEVTA